jgi:serine protease Do
MEIAPVSCRRLLAATWCVLESLGVASGPSVGAGPTAVYDLVAPPAPRAVDEVASGEPIEHVAAWPSWLGGGGRPLFDRTTTAPAVPCTPHPAVARIIVPEQGATAYGSGTLVDVREQFGLVITNWHVVRDSQGTVEVVFPSGFRSHARPLKVDSDWDLAALVIWRPPIEPVRVSAVPPQPGDPLTIHGYGQGQYRIATGRCTAYYAPKMNFPREMVELDVEARQGDSGGPIFNQRGELAGVLFGAGEGTTIGSFAPRVESFLATLAPDIGAGRNDTQIAVADRPAPEVHARDSMSSSSDGLVASTTRAQESAATVPDWPSTPWNPAIKSDKLQKPGDHQQVAAIDVAGSGDWYDGIKSALALVGLAAVALQLMRLVK